MRTRPIFIFRGTGLYGQESRFSPLSASMQPMWQWATIHNSLATGLFREARVRP
jgi:hypothetical protein